jgi:hypothetical protein
MPHTKQELAADAAHQRSAFGPGTRGAQCRSGVPHSHFATAIQARSAGREYTPLRCVERVWGIEVLAEATTNGWLQVRVDFDVCGVGRWQSNLSICVPSATTLEEIQNRRETFMALQIGGRVAANAQNATPF